MKHAVILSLDDLRHITMIKLYTDYFDVNNIAYDIVCLNRYHEKNLSYGKANVYSFDGTDVKDSKIKKLLNYLKYRKYAISILNRNRYDYTVVWGERTAAVFSTYLKNNKPYCINIRDIGLPKVPFFFDRLRDAVEHSDFSTWCAPRGQEDLPKYDYVLVYNQNIKLVEGALTATSFVEKGVPIRIGTIGYIRHVEPSKQLMRAFCNDERFLIQFFGTGAERLEQYAHEIGMKNIEIKGTFQPEETAALLNKTDVINSYCGNGAIDKTIAIGTPIRYGYSTLLFKPAIVSPNTYISDKTGQLNIAFTAENLDTLPEDFYKWYYSLSFDDFANGCMSFNKEFSDSIDNLHKVCDRTIKPLFQET